MWVPDRLRSESGSRAASLLPLQQPRVETVDVVIEVHLPLFQPDALAVAAQELSVAAEQGGGGRLIGDHRNLRERAVFVRGRRSLQEGGRDVGRFCGRELRLD